MEAEWAAISKRLQVLLVDEWRRGVICAESVNKEFPSYSEFIDSFACWVERETDSRRKELYGE